jgi:hypothetical protein
VIEAAAAKSAELGKKYQAKVDQFLALGDTLVLLSLGLLVNFLGRKCPGLGQSYIHSVSRTVRRQRSDLARGLLS